MLNKEACKNCRDRKEFQEQLEETNPYAVGIAKPPSFEHGWKHYNVVLCPFATNEWVMRNDEWEGYKLPIRSDYPPECPYHLEQLLSKSEQEKSRVSSPAIGSVLSTACECGGIFELVRVFYGKYSKVAYRCQRCRKEQKANQKTGELIDNSK